jgi:hypothetical protein
VKRTLIDGTVAEKAKRHPIFISIFAGESETTGQRHMRSDDGMPSIHVMLFIEKMHRTAQSPRTAGVFSEKFGHAGIGARSARESMGVIAIGSNDVVVEANGCDGTDHNRFLADVKMTKTADFLRLILLTRALFKTPDEQHQPEHLDFVALLCRLHGNQAARASATSLPLRADGARINRTKTMVKMKSLRSELRKNIQVGVAPYCGRPTVSASMNPAKSFA